MTGIKYEPLSDIADALGTSMDAVVEALVELGLATETPEQHVPRQLGARFSTPAGQWDMRLHDVIDAQFGVWCSMLEATQAASVRLREIANAEPRDEGSQ